MSLETVIEDHKNDQGSEDADVLEEYQPLISDNLQIGYYSINRSCQTNISEVVELKKVADVIFVLMKEVTDLKKSLYYAKLTLQAEHDDKLKNSVNELDMQAKKKINELEERHKEQIKIVRQSFRTQLANAICKLSKDYHYFYGNKNIDVIMNERLQTDEIKLTKQQINDTADKTSEILSTKSSLLSTTCFIEEIELLKKAIEEYKSRIGYLEDLLEESTNENDRLNSDIINLSNNLTKEQKIIVKLHEEITTCCKQMKAAEMQAEKKIKKQAIIFKKEMNDQLQALTYKLKNEADDKLIDLKRIHSEKLNAQKFLEAQNLKELKIQRKQQNQTKEVSIAVVEADTSHLQQILKQQHGEIAKLKMELERTNKMWDLKSKILQEHVHVLKNEMFVRTTLQRQVAKMGQATVNFVKEGSVTIPLGVQPLKNKFNVSRKYQLPSIIDGSSYARNNDLIGSDRSFSSSTKSEIN